MDTVQAESWQDIRAFRTPRPAAWLLLLVASGIIAAAFANGRVSGKLSYWSVSYHHMSRHRDMRSFYEHGAALRDYAIAGNERALRILLDDTRADGANTYTQFNLTIDCVRAISDQRLAAVIVRLTPEAHERLRYYLSYVSDLSTRRPLTCKAVRLTGAPTSHSLPLDNPGLLWP